MPNIASIFKEEISRLARKELRSETTPLRKASSMHRVEIAALKRRVAELERALRASLKAGSRERVQSSSAETGEESEASAFRFRAAGMAANRKRLGLSAHDFGLLVGTTGQSIYAWEQGRAKPRAKNLAAIAALRGLGKKEVAARLEALK